MEKINLDNGKYIVIIHDNYTMEALRYGEPWRNLTGDNLIYYMFQRIIDLEERIKHSKGKQVINRANLLRIIRREAPAFEIRFTGYWADARKSPKFIDGKSMRFRIAPDAQPCDLLKYAAYLGAKVYGLTGANFAVTVNQSPYCGKTYYIEFTL